MDLTISIVSYNIKSLLRECLNSIYRNVKRIKFEVIVVDNASNDGGIEMLRKEFPQVKLIVNHNNLGFARANNQAIKQSRGRYILLCNPDVVIKSNSLDGMVEFMETHPNAGALGCKILNSDQTMQTSTNSFPNLFTVFLHIFQAKKIISNPKMRETIGRKWKILPGTTLREYFRIYGDFDRIREVDWVTGACLLVRRKTIEEVGLLDENFFMYYEDTDWCYRMRKKGWKTFYFPFFEVIHYIGKSSNKFNPKVFIERYKSMYYYFRKHKGKGVIPLLHFIICSGLILRFISLLTIYLFNKDKELKKKLCTYLIVMKGFKCENTIHHSQTPLSSL